MIRVTFSVEPRRHWYPKLGHVQRDKRNFHEFNFFIHKYIINVKYFVNYDASLLLVYRGVVAMRHQYYTLCNIRTNFEIYLGKDLNSKQSYARTSANNFPTFFSNSGNLSTAPSLLRVVSASRTADHDVGPWVAAPTRPMDGLGSLATCLCVPGKCLISR